MQLVDTPKTPEELRKALHGRIDRLAAPELSMLNKFAAVLEAEDLANELTSSFEADFQSGKLSTEKIADAINKFRSQHPYK